eukprot:3821997-Rhodomonas_salina.1
MQSTCAPTGRASSSTVLGCAMLIMPHISISAVIEIGLSVQCAVRGYTACYAMSGTEIGHAIWRTAGKTSRAGHDQGGVPCTICLRLSYAMSGTEMEYCWYQDLERRDVERYGLKLLRQLLRTIDLVSNTLSDLLRYLRPSGDLPLSSHYYLSYLVTSIARGPGELTCTSRGELTDI